jgi:hypothetical protein
MGTRHDGNGSASSFGTHNAGLRSVCDDSDVGHTLLLNKEEYPYRVNGADDTPLVNHFCQQLLSPIFVDNFFLFNKTAAHPWRVYLLSR